MLYGFISVIYMISAILFIISLAYFSQQQTSKKGNLCAISGMFFAIITTICNNYYNIIYIIIAIFLGAIIGINISKKINMTKIPQLIAILHSFVGLTAITVGFNSFLLMVHFHHINKLQLSEIFISIFIGTITLIGSIIAFGKLSNILSSNNYIIKYKHTINIINFIFICVLMTIFLTINNIKLQFLILILMIINTLFLSFTLIMGINGADMPIVISMLNSYSGWAASASGFILNNDLLIITGALVGSSGAILAYLMCKGMNRSFLNIILGGQHKKNIVIHNNIKQIYQNINIKDTINILKTSNNIIIVPGYGLAVAQAQHILSKIVKKLFSYNVKIKFAIHPVAGRLPGHMNVLLAEAKIPYNMIFEMNEINNDFQNTDTVIIIGANDTVNPAALENIESPISGMPVLHVWKAKKIIILKRSMGQGYSGIDNPLFYNKKSYMLFGDAKDNLNKISQNM
ncbi:NAD(P)(+) transhydrogenase (Re/Si-specific) subunit beta [Enterobacteriaceae endosymbiont of Macroplea appendiculata]|uniref:NAD(P)(+) transhydrogenase (Re/Si-specific) subunit beta n=1 Tax=Enterobacteriaceae endosymbiont of Macroplea appendiculata TaxID=2675790 RepID=UPI001449856A|nr:NAD(P)(+) transhydrogenase (Re/Si-specific) subunit beta [Enterobacteriaceae endosymbiont of Macroplea appendiculata]QJC30699.1 Re/Si-specific NAD(P)(+) transhydrogenase subunit beta [Enterobacteriaceae endosymbiont of Macroplea appendiculata]